MKSKFILLGTALLLSASVYAQPTATTAGKKYALIMDGTGAWCPYCADGLAIMEDNITMANAIKVAVHNASSGRPDGMEFPEGEAWNNNWCLGPLGYPYGTVDCHFFGYSGNPGQDTVVGLNRGLWVNALNARLAETSQYDLTMSQKWDNATRTITVTLTGKALAALTGSYNFNVLLTEDEVTGSGSGFNQANSENATVGHKYYGKGSPMTSFKHPHVLRAMMGGTWGVSAATNPAANSTVTKTFTYVIPATYSNSDGSSTPDLTKMHLVAFVQKQGTGSKVNNKGMDILNSVQAPFYAWTTGVNNVATNFGELEMFPNPANNAVTVKASLNNASDVKISITNTLGQVVFNQVYPKGSTMFNETISLDKMNNGMYYVTVASEGHSTTQKLVVSK